MKRALQQVSALTLTALLALPALAQDQSTPAATPSPEQAQTPEQVPAATPDHEPGTLRFHLMDGTVITGRLTTEHLNVNTAFGDLAVPITAIQRLSPGLISHEQLNEQIQTLIQQLAEPRAEVRDRAQEALAAYGPALLPELQRHADTPDAERRVRINTIIEAIYANADTTMQIEDGPNVSLLQLDTIVTEQFTVAGDIQQSTFNIVSSFGQLTVEIADIKAAEHLSAELPEIRRSISVLGSDMACTNYRDTGIRVRRGDRVIISANGRVTMTPWGGNAMSGPDGIAQNGMYNAQIPLGALAGRIGNNGPELLIGSQSSFVAEQSGTLYLGFAMLPNWANYQFPGQYETNVRVVPGQ